MMHELKNILAAKIYRIRKKNIKIQFSQTCLLRFNIPTKFIAMSEGFPFQFATKKETNQKIVGFRKNSCENYIAPLMTVIIIIIHVMYFC